MLCVDVVFVPGLSELHLCQLLAASSPVTLGVAVAAPWQGTWFNLLSDVTRMGSCIHQVFADNVLQCKYQKSQHWQLMHSAENVFFFDFIVQTQVLVHRIFEASITSLYPLVEQCSRHITCRMQLPTIITIYCLPTYCLLCTIKPYSSLTEVRADLRKSN